MRIAARLALATEKPYEAILGASAVRLVDSAPLASVGHRSAYHGIDVILRSLSADGFAASTSTAFPPNAMVRLRLPGIGVIGAQVISAEPGHVDCRFMTPLPPARLSRALGIRAAAHA